MNVQDIYVDLQGLPPKKIVYSTQFSFLAFSHFPLSVLKIINKYRQLHFSVFLSTVSVFFGTRVTWGTKVLSNSQKKHGLESTNNVFIMVISFPSFFDASFADILSCYNRSHWCWSSTFCSFSFLFGVRRAFCSSSNCTAGPYKIGYHSVTKKKLHH